MKLIDIECEALSPEERMIIEDEASKLIEKSPEFVELIRKLQENQIFYILTGKPKLP